MIRAIVKAIGFFLMVAVYSLVSLGAIFILRGDKQERALMKLTSLCAKLGLFIFGIKISIKNRENLSRIPPCCLIISNHLTYLDILVICSRIPSLFITSVEVKNTFFLGFLSRMGGSIFVERRKKTQLLREIENVSGKIMRGTRVTLFPEGTSSNGETVLPFKSALFTSAVSAGVDVQPLCIRYLSINGKKIDRENRDYVFYYGDLKFFPHLCKLMTLKRVEVELSVLQQIDTKDLTRKELVSGAEAVVRNCYESGV
ncbi:1-acyl-sn-glycerol-3-phosphate acyltransferase [Chitinispirillum alkaliphilum]|nr:1-acyl-sn-glycerol-3-phosphate acyltransferase [Chitinispirillum alkaliphilum]